MTSRQKIATKKSKDEAEAEERRRYYDRNLDAMKWCNNNGFTIYAANQAHNSNVVKLFKQKGERFLPLSKKEYDQTDLKEVIAYVAAIDTEYERIYNLKKEQHVNKEKV